MKTTIPNEEIPRCKTCKRFFKPFAGKCGLHKNILVYPKVYEDGFCDYHENKFVSRAEVIESVTPFSPGWQAEQRNAFAKWYNNK